MSSDIAALIRTYNSESTLESCLDSLDSQSRPPEQLIVVDSGSNDRTIPIARAHDADVVLYPDEEFNYSRAINIGMEHVQTSYVLIMSSHVTLPAVHSLEVMQLLLTEDEKRCAASIRGYASSPFEVDTEGVESEIVTKTNFISRYGGSGITNSCNLIPYEFWASHPFDESIPGCEDQKWLQYHLNQGRVAVRIQRPQMVYENPYYGDTKRINETVTLAKYGINQSLLEWSSLGKRLYAAASGLWNGNREQFRDQLYLFCRLLNVRLGFDGELSSQSFVTIDES